MFPQISCTPDFEQTFWPKKCSFYAVFFMVDVQVNVEMGLYAYLSKHLCYCNCFQKKRIFNQFFKMSFDPDDPVM